MQLVTAIGISASIFSAICSIPQLLKIIKEKNAKSISINMLVILIIGLLLWTYYGILLKDIIIIISNAFSAAINMLILIFSFLYKKKVETGVLLKALK